MISEITTHEALDAVWPDIEPMVERALEGSQGDCTTSDNVRDDIRRQELICWVVHEDKKIEAVLILSVNKLPIGKKVYIHILAEGTNGRGMDGYGDELEQVIIDYAKLQGAFCVEASCRKGLGRYLERRPNSKWRQKAVIMEISHEQLEV